MSEGKNKALFVVDTQDHSYHVNFRYSESRGARNTWCEIDVYKWDTSQYHAGSKKIAEACGLTRCAPTDNFCRATGRKRALARALFQLTGIWKEIYSQEEIRQLRKRFWDRYFNVCKA